MKWLIAVVVVAVSASQVQAGFLADGFSVSAFTPKDFQSSTVLSLAFNPSGALFASNGIHLSTVPLNGGTSVSESLRPPIANKRSVTVSATS